MIGRAFSGSENRVLDVVKRVVNEGLSASTVPTPTKIHHRGYASNSVLPLVISHLLSTLIDRIYRLYSHPRSMRFSR